MNILIIGGGPGGLYSGLLLKKSDPAHRIKILERNPRGVTWGWGVVFSDRTLNHFREADAPTFDAITSRFVVWDAIDIYFKDRLMRCGGNVFAGMARRDLLDILEKRCLELDIEICHETELRDLAGLDDYDLVIAADGVSSLVRQTLAEHFQPTLTPGRAHYIWYGTQRVFDSFTFSIKTNENGVFQAHAYPFDGQTSTFIVECDEQSWRAAGFDAMSDAESITACEALFADVLRGHKLLSNNSKWLVFNTLKCRKWHHGNIVLVGDAAHTAHFSIGSGTKLAMEDAIALARSFEVHGTVEAALTDYALDRQPRAAALQASAAESQDYFETLRRFVHLEPEQFAFHLLTRSGRLNYDNLRLRDAAYVEGVERWFSSHSDGGQRAAPLIAPPPLFTPLRLRGLALYNRAVLSAPSTDTAADGLIAQSDADRLLERARGGAALILSQPVAASAEGRITPGTPGLYHEAQKAAWARLAESVHAQTSAKLGVRLTHAGRRGATLPRRAGLDRPLPPGERWPLVAPSPIPYTPASPKPKQMTRADMEKVRDEFVNAVRMAAEAGVDLLALDMAHGYLLGSFLSPLANQRKDKFGGSAENRARFPLEVVEAVRDVWPEDRPLAVALNASDWARGGITIDEAVNFARMLKSRDCDLLWPLAGYTTPDFDPTYGPDFLAAHSERLRMEVGLPTLVGGGIATTNQANSILAAGRADLCILDLA